MSDVFYNERDTKNIEKIREISSRLPDFVTEFAVSIQLRTTPLTRLGYVSDIRIFFNYLIKQNFRDLKTEKDVTINDLAALKAYDIELFLDYLGSYHIDGKHYKCGVEAKERKLSSLRTFFKFLYRHEKLSENITEKVETPKIHEKPIRFLEVNEIAELLDVAESGRALTPRQKAFQNITKRTRFRLFVKAERKRFCIFRTRLQRRLPHISAGSTSKKNSEPTFQRKFRTRTRCFYRFKANA